MRERSTITSKESQKNLRHMPATKHMYSVFMMLFFVVSFSGLLTSCGTLSNGRLGQNNDIHSSDSRRFVGSVRDAFLDYRTLIPAAAALVFAVDDLDERVSDWATKENPIFGSEECSRDVSDALRATLLIEALSTAMVAPQAGGYEKKEHSRSKVVGVELLAMGVTGGLTVAIKNSVERNRPDDSNEESFPSGHASGVFSYAFLANRNLERTRLSTPLKLSLQTMNVCLAAGVSWARVEGDKHFPSDVLAGAALGHFVTSAIFNTFIEMPDQKNYSFMIFPCKGGAVAQLSFAF
ncbi:MAG: phosphatase PAP2 family protein [Thermodesulfobacteriota bacterium]|nr:phosphatase PAP2 family protein [Thermodesulfobacteriota bacterium]